MMIISICINSSKYFSCDRFEKMIEWQFPVIPREGDWLLSAFLAVYIKPKEFYGELTKEQKREWGKIRKEYKKYKLDIDESSVLKQILYRMNIRVESIEWTEHEFFGVCPRINAKCNESEEETLQIP